MHVQAIIDIARQAGQSIMQIYKQDFAVEQKADQSPLTVADQTAHQIIVEGLAKLDPQTPILSEEGRAIGFDERSKWQRFWLVDPLDGTKEFIKKNDEFTVNIALIEQGFPVIGVVYAPALDTLYVGTPTEAYKVDDTGNRTELKVKAEKSNTLTIVESRSHPSKELEDLMTQLKSEYAEVQRIQRGSSLKLCAVAEGVADLYPRLGPTMEWDTAAGQAVVEAAGGQVTTLDGKRLSYNKESLLNDYFLVQGQRILK